MELFSDETSTGRIHGARYSKATVAARIAADVSDFDWWHAWVREFLPTLGEAKSDKVLPICDADPRARDLLLRGIANCEIFVIDVAASSRALLEPLRRFWPEGLDAEQLRTSSSDQFRMVASMAKTLREIEIMSSAIGEIEDLIRSEPMLVGVARELGMTTKHAERFAFDPMALRSLNPKEFRLLVTRAAVALGDALAPEAQARAFEELAVGRKYFLGASIGCHFFKGPLENDYTFDKSASAKVSTELDSAHSRIKAFIDAERDRSSLERIRGGRIAENDSALVSGIQVADIGAAYAAYALERLGAPAIENVRTLKNTFQKVFFNTIWL